MSLLEKVNELLINILTTDLAEHISDEFGLDVVEVSREIKNYLDQISTPGTPIIPVQPKKLDKVLKPPVNKGRVCIFVFQRGAKSGKQCETILRAEGNYCSKHKHRKMLNNNNNGMVSS